MMVVVTVWIMGCWWEHGCGGDRGDCDDCCVDPRGGGSGCCGRGTGCGGEATGGGDCGVILRRLLFWLLVVVAVVAVVVGAVVVGACEVVVR